jgi:hypothetical protein
MSRRAAAYVDRILKGEKPDELPVQQSTNLRFFLNLHTAKRSVSTYRPTCWRSPTSLSSSPSPAGESMPTTVLVRAE